MRAAVRSYRGGVTGLRTLDRATGLRPGDHACWAYASRRAFTETAAHCLEEGARRGERLLYVGTRATEGLLDDLAGLAGRDELLESGRLTVHHVDAVYDTSTPLEHDEQVESFRAATREAEAEGYPAVRVVADVTPLAASSGDLRRMAAYELAVDAMIATHPMTALCAYDERVVGDRTGALAALHSLQHRSSRPATFAVALRDHTLILTGEIDSACALDLRHVLTAVQDVTEGPLVLDLSPLDFIDVAGARALVRAVSHMVGSGREMPVRGARSAARRCLALFDPDLVDRDGPTP